MDIRLKPIGYISTPYKEIDACPRNIMTGGPPCWLVVDDEYAEGLYGLGPGANVLVLYWMDKASFKNLILTSRMSGETKGVFALRSPHRPNPIGAAVLKIEELDGNRILVRGLDCLDRTPLLDIKPAMSNEIP